MRPRNRRIASLSLAEVSGAKIIARSKGAKTASRKRSGARRSADGGFFRQQPSSSHSKLKKGRREEKESGGGRSPRAHLGGRDARIPREKMTKNPRANGRAVRQVAHRSRVCALLAPRRAALARSVPAPRRTTGAGLRGPALPP